MVLMRLPLTITGRCRGVGPWACAASSRPQLQKAMPPAAAPLRKFRRVVMLFPPFCIGGELATSYRPIVILIFDYGLSLVVIASEAKQSRKQRSKTGLLRRSAPRNDGAGRHRFGLDR